jgi:hypothetical protein
MTSTKQTPLPVLPPDHRAFQDEAEAALDALVVQCSALTGRPVGLSTLIRALAVYAQRQGADWISTELLSLITSQSVLASLLASRFYLEFCGL